KKGYPITKDDVLHIAQSLGIDTDKLQKDMQSKQVAQQLNTNYKLAKEVGIKPPLGTPAFFVGNLDKNKFRFVPGQVQQQNLQQAIDYVSR
ncbi:MAG: DsbA family protein, partial [Gammaproteobacteria bacterium]|nr:DsbA family protein [Gammaproteobacteria bacterium]